MQNRTVRELFLPQRHGDHGEITLQIPVSPIRLEVGCVHDMRCKRRLDVE